MKNKTPKLAIVIVTYNSAEMTSEQLKNLEIVNLKNIDATCIVVDNNSSDDSLKKLSSLHLTNMKYVYLRNKKNLGFAGGNNVGIKYACDNNFDYLVLMNNDLVLSPKVFAELLDYLADNNQVGIVSPKIYFAKGFEFHKNKYKELDKGKVIWYAGGIIDRLNVYTSHRGVDEVDYGQYDQISETDTASGAFMMMPVSVFAKVGFLDENLFLYWEDADLSTRIRRAGYKVIYYPFCSVWHKVSVTTGGSGSASNDYYLTRNRYFYALKYSSLRTKIAVIRDTFRLMIKGRRWQKIGAKDALIGIKGGGSWKN